MSNLINFDFQSQAVRVELKNGEPLFCLTDVACILNIQNARQLPLDEKGVEKIYISHESGKKLATFINEPNLYRVIFRSNKAEAVKFQNWVFEEVLPSIRKTGNYSQKTNAHQRQALVTACDKLAVGNTLRSDIYKMVGNQFGVDDIQSIPMHQLADATAFVYEILLAKSAQPNHNAHNEHNAFWRTVGVLEYTRLADEMRAMEIALNDLANRFYKLNNSKGLIYDALDQQRITNQTSQRTQALAFINRQMALKAI